MFFCAINKIMAIRNFKIYSLSILLIILFSCSKSSNNSGPKDCKVALVAPVALSQNQQVEYLAGVSNAGGTITSLTYADSTGTTTLSNPTLPWTKFVNMKAGSVPSISFQGTANKGGQINISFVIQGVQTGTDCSN